MKPAVCKAERLLKSLEGWCIPETKINIASQPPIAQVKEWKVMLEDIIKEIKNG